MPFQFDESQTDKRSAASDLAAIEILIERCERELVDTDLNVKLTDFVRLLEFRAKLKPAVDAEKAFWSMINDMRREELHRGDNRHS